MSSYRPVKINGFHTPIPHYINIKVGTVKHG